MQNTKQRPWAVEEAVSNAGIVASVVNVAAHLINDMNFVNPDGSRNLQLDQLHGIIFAADKLMKDFVDEIDALPRQKVTA